MIVSFVSEQCVYCRRLVLFVIFGVAESMCVCVCSSHFSRQLVYLLIVFMIGNYAASSSKCYICRVYYLLVILVI